MTPLAILKHIIAWLPLVIGGIFFIRAGLRGRRINDHPICRKCRFDLVGLGADSAHPDRCPECGTDLTGITRRARRAVINGERRKRWPILALGLALLLSGLTTGFWLSYKPLAKFPWTTWMPDWVLAEMIDSPHSTRGATVGREIMLRLQNNRFSASSTDRTISSILAAQADPNVLWSPVMGDIVELARAHGLVSDDAMSAYIQRSFTAIARVRPRVGRDERLAWETVVMFGRAGNGLGHARDGKPEFVLNLKSSKHAVVMPDGSNRDISNGGSWSRFMSNSSTSNTGAFKHGLPLGRHELTFLVRLSGHENMDTHLTNSPPAAIYVQDIEIPITVEVVDSTQIVGTVDESKREEFERAFLVSLLDIKPHPPEAARDSQEGIDERIRLHIDARSPPLPYAFEVTMRLGERAIPMGRMVGVAMKGHIIHGLFEADPHMNPIREPLPPLATIILTPNPDLAKHRVDITEIWGDSITIENVPITIIKPPDTPRADEDEIPDENE
ncbi:MAG: hypothetical protein KF912_10235 [Phycisphaeraceae bacterium]|nr:hypothetical protein [Phycisphaeraceae bacterium]MBX3367675.1 hypothetical protein [Phycisphaeraceae bacterium]